MMSVRPVQHSAWWCDFPQAPDDHTHSHTAAVAQVLLGHGVTADVVLVQTPGEVAVVRMHLTGPGVRSEVDLSGVQAWSLAGVLIDATVTHRQVSAGPPAGSESDTDVAPADQVPTEPAVASSSSGRTGLAAPVRWWMARHRAVGPRRVRAAFRCPPPVPPPQIGPADDEPDPGPWW